MSDSSTTLSDPSLNLVFFYFIVVDTILLYLYYKHCPHRFEAFMLLSHGDFAIICPLLYGCSQDRPALLKWWAWSRFDSRWTHAALRQNRDIIMRDDTELWWIWWNIQYPTCVLMFSQSCCRSLQQSGEYSQRNFEIKCHKREHQRVHLYSRKQHLRHL